MIGSPTLSADELKLVSNSGKARESVLKSSEWFLRFLTRNRNWTIGHNHNHLRITRMFRSLKLIGEKAIAENQYASVLSILKIKEDNRSVQKALVFWEHEIAS